MEQPLTPSQALERAVDLLGSQAALARLLGIAQPSVWKWVRLGKHLPPQHVLKVEQATGVSKHLLRPDIYPVDDVEAATPTVAGDQLTISQRERRA